MATRENPLNLPQEGNGQFHQLRLQRLVDPGADRRAAQCAPTLNHIHRTDQTARFNSMERALQMAVLLIREEAGSHARADAFLASPLEWQQRALYRSAHCDENLAILYQESKLGFIAEFVAYRASLGYRQALNPAPPGQIVAGAGSGGQGGRYDQAYLEGKMQADDLKN